MAITIPIGLRGLVNVFVDESNAIEKAPGTAYFEFDTYANASDACKEASRSWELYCVDLVPKETVDRKCFGFAVKPEARYEANIQTIVELVKKVAYWMGGSLKEANTQIPINTIRPESLKKREFSVPQKDYRAIVGQFGLKLACEDPYREAQETEVLSFKIKKDSLQPLNKLVADLEKLPPSHLRDTIIKKVNVGFYSNFISQSTMLAVDLMAAGFEELARNAKMGEYAD